MENKEDGQVGGAFVNLAGSRIAAHDGHGQVQDDQIRMEFEGLADSCGAVASLKHFDFRAGGQDRTDTCADDLMVVYNQHTNHIVSPGTKDGLTLLRGHVLVVIGENV
jgi:hypothetical protein